MSSASTRDRVRYVLVGLAIVVLLGPPLIGLSKRVLGLLVWAIPPSPRWAASTPEVAHLLVVLPVAALGIAYIARPARLAAAFWVLPLFFIVQGLLDLLFVGSGFVAPLSASRAAALPAVPSLLLAGLLWLLRPPDVSSEPGRRDGERRTTLTG